MREIAIPDLEVGRVAHTITIAGEMTQALARYDADHRSEHGLDVRINLALARQFTARDYIQAQRVRTRMMANFERALEAGGRHHHPDHWPARAGHPPGRSAARRL